VPGGMALVGAVVAEAWADYCASVLRKRLTTIAPDDKKNIDAGANACDRAT
jgi:hypothetical protein